MEFDVEEIEVPRKWQLRLEMPFRFDGVNGKIRLRGKDSFVGTQSIR